MRVIDLGAGVPYGEGMDIMRRAMAAVDARTRAIDNDNNGDRSATWDARVGGPVLLLLEHTPVITITRKGGTGAFVSPPALIEADGIEVVQTDRGGDVTFHGPGQLVGYPILRLGPTSLGCDVVGYVRALEQGIIDAVTALGVSGAHHVEGKDAGGNFLTGVWCPVPEAAAAAQALFGAEHQEAKLAAIGVGLGGGVTRHGFALNVTVNLERYARHVVPCGLTGRAVTSLERVLPQAPAMATVKEAVAQALLPRLSALHSPG